MAERKRKRVVQQHPDRRANRTILMRTLVLLVVFGVMAFVPLFLRLWDLQITNGEEYQQKAIEQQTRDSKVEANRGTIFDSKGERLAASATVYNIQLSPKGVKEAQEAYAKQVEEAAGDKDKMPDWPEPTDEYIASSLAAILSIDQEDILARLEKEWSQYEILKWRVGDDEANAVREFIVDTHLSEGLFVMPTTKRFYFKNSLAAQVIGWVNPNTDNTGAYGMEAVYEDELSGETGRVVTAKNGKGTEMLYRFEEYYDATDGNDLTLTLDSTIQYFCERILEKGVAQFDVQDGGFCLAMDPNTGEILAWANSPTYDLNDPWSVTDPILNKRLTDAQSGTWEEDDPIFQQYLEDVQSGEYTKEEAYEKAMSSLETDVLNTQWKNKAINSTYEPGSTFKSIVLAAALEEGVVTESDHFYCSGVAKVEGWNGPPIRCSKREGHGDQDLAKAVANSCNPAFVEIGKRLGAEKFYDYLEDFGFLEATGIDMLGEPTHYVPTLTWSREAFTNVDLAVASFGQRFNVTPIQMITAASAVINGGHLMKPYVVSKITDPEGNVVQHTEPTEVRQVVSEQTSERCRAILEKVVDGGTGKNAAVEGYRIGGKTGSSEVGLEEDHTIVSFLGFAPADDPQVVILLAYDNPKPAYPGANVTKDNWYISGGNMAALMAGELLEDILDYMGVEKTYSATADVMVPNLTGLDLATATSSLKKANLTIRTVGEGTNVTGQIPASGAQIPGGSEVVVYMGAEVPTDQVQVPSVIGLNAEQARQKLANAGLYMKASGVAEYSGNVVAYEQSQAAGTSVDRGTVVEVRFTDSAASGAGL